MPGGAGASRAFSAWQRDLPALTSEDWSEGLQQYIPLMISAKERFIQLKFIHRVYYTPQRLAVIYHTSEDKCPRCGREVGNFIHMVWLCPKVQEFWRLVAAEIESIGGVAVGLNPLILLLGITDNLPTSTHKKLFIFYTAFYARKAILLQWKVADPPGLSAWRKLVNDTLPMYKLTYMGRNCPKKFDKVWGAWVVARRLTV